MNRYLVILLGLFLSFQASGQQTPLDSLIDYILMGDEEAIRLLDSEKDEHFLYLSTGFSPHTYYAGREIGDNILNISGQAIYLHPKGFYMGVAGGWYQQLQPQYNMTMLSVGWSDKLKKSDHLRLRGSFGHYIF
ncbi:MAG: hypothetical protein OEX02_13795, partial [Cyclobacteriaceae bacterium]|nr:hypothetical protein [Cyclobacteriaceae bacterium]